MYLSKTSICDDCNKLIQFQYYYIVVISMDFVVDSSTNLPGFNVKTIRTI